MLAAPRRLSLRCCQPDFPDHFFPHLLSPPPLPTSFPTSFPPNPRASPAQIRKYRPRVTLFWGLYEAALSGVMAAAVAVLLTYSLRVVSRAPQQA